MIFSCRINAVMAEVLTRYGSFGHRDRCPVLDWGMRVDGIRISPDDNGADRLSWLCCTIPPIGRAATFEGFSYATECVRGIPRAVKRLRTAIRT